MAEHLSLLEHSVDSDVNSLQQQQLHHRDVAQLLVGDRQRNRCCAAACIAHASAGAGGSVLLRWLRCAPIMTWCTSALSATSADTSEDRQKDEVDRHNLVITTIRQCGDLFSERMRGEGLTSRRRGNAKQRAKGVCHEELEARTSRRGT